MGGASGGAEATEQQQPVQRDDDQCAREAQLFPDGGKDEIGMHDGDVGRIAQPQPAPKDSTGPKGQQALHDLKSPVGRLRPGVDPTIHPQRDPAGEVVAGQTGDGEERQPGRDVFPLAGRQVEHRQEGKKEQHGRAQVLLPGQEHHRQSKHRQERADVGQ